MIQNRIRWRKNVLSLMLLAYLSLLGIFCVLVFGGDGSSSTTETIEAYNIIKDPLMALIGGTLALAKDLVPFGDEDSAESKTPENSSNDKQKQGQDKTTP